MEIKNAKITGVSLTMADHGILTFQIFIEGGGWACSIGNYVNGKGYLGAKHWEVHGSGLVAMMKIMDVVGVKKWEDLTGKYIRVVDNDWGSTITKIGNILKDEWFDLREFFAAVGEDDVYKYDDPKSAWEEDLEED